MIHLIKKNKIGYGLIVMIMACISMERNLIVEQGNFKEAFNPIFVIAYAATLLYIIYTSIQIFRGKITQAEIRIKASIISSLLILNFLLFNLILSFTSSFSSWVHYFFLLMIGTILALPYQKYLPKITNLALQFFIGGFTLITIYFTIYLLPIYPILLTTSVFFGVSLLGFVPLLISIYFIRIIQLNPKRLQRLAVLSGLVTGIIFSVTYISLLNRNDKVIASIPPQELATSIPINGFAEKMIMGSYVYDSFNNYWVGNSKGSNIKRHDPLVSMALIFSNKNTFNKNERIDLLNNQFSKLEGSHQYVWQQTIYKAEEMIASTNKSLWQWYIIMFVFPLLLIISFNQLSKTDY